MKKISINRGWEFQHGMMQPWTRLQQEKRIVDLPHDYMIESEVREDAPAQGASG